MTHSGAVWVALGKHLEGLLLSLSCEEKLTCDSMGRCVLKKAFIKSSIAWYTLRTMARIFEVVVMLNTDAWMEKYHLVLFSVVHGYLP